MVEISSKDLVIEDQILTPEASVPQQSDSYRVTGQVTDSLALLCMSDKDKSPLSERQITVVVNEVEKEKASNKTDNINDLSGKMNPIKDQSYVDVADSVSEQSVAMGDFLQVQVDFAQLTSVLTK